ncbi:MAG: hypothetical protein ACLT76_06340 [Clostridium fessum]
MADNCHLGTTVQVKCRGCQCSISILDKPELAPILSTQQTWDPTDPKFN